MLLSLDKEKQKEVWFDKALKKNPLDLTLLFALTYWHNWPIFQLVLLCMSYFASSRKRERHSGMHLLIQNLFWHKCLQYLLRITGLHVP